MALLPGLTRQFLPEVFPQWIQVNILDLSVGQMIMAPFCNSFGLPHSDPVGIKSQKLGGRDFKWDLFTHHPLSSSKPNVQEKIFVERVFLKEKSEIGSTGGAYEFKKLLFCFKMLLKMACNEKSWFENRREFKDLALLNYLMRSNASCTNGQQAGETRMYELGKV